MAAGIVSKSPPNPFFSASLSQDKSSTCSLTPQQTLYSSSSSSSPKTHFHGFKQPTNKSHKGYRSISPIQMSLRVPKAQRWWEKGVQKNMREVSSAQDLVSSLLYAGDQLVIVDFFSPGCGGCRALHPKICQFAEMNPDVQFLQINYEEHKSMCYSLNVHVLPFFRFYRGAHGRLCSFSCTNATIKKFKDALAKHTTERCSLGPTKGLEEAELLALAGNKDLNFDYTPNPSMEPLPANIEQHPSPATPSQPIRRSEEEKTLVTAGGVEQKN